MAQIQSFLSNLRDKPQRFAERNPYLILVVVCSAQFLDLSNLSAITIALPTIQKEFGTNEGNLQWAISAYALTFGSFLLLGGRGGDMFGHRRVLLFGCTVFGLFTLVCALAPSFIGLVVARAFQGIGAAFTIPSAQAHIVLTFPDPKQKATAIGYWGASGSIGFIVGLILGGVLTDELSWRWIFWISLIICVIVLPAAYLTLPSRKRPSSPAPESDDVRNTFRDLHRPPKKFMTSVKERFVRFDVLGIFLGIPGLLLLTYALTSANVSGWDSAGIITTLVIAAVLLTLFVFHERRADQALLPVHLFKSVSFDLTLVLAVCTYAVRQACTYFLTLQLQSFGNSPIHTSVLFLPLGVTALISNTVTGRIVPIFGARVMFVAGWALSIPAVTLFAQITPETSYWRFTFPGMILYMGGIGCVYICANFVVVSSASASDQGVAAGIFNVALQVGGSVLGLAVLTAVAQGMNRVYGDGSAALGEVGYRAVYYSCLILCGIALTISLFGIRVPESMGGSIWKKKEPKREDSAASTIPLKRLQSDVLKKTCSPPTIGRVASTN